MTPDTIDDEGQRGIDRRDLLRRGALAAGGLALGTLAVADEATADDKPTTYSRDLGGDITRYSPCTDERVAVTRGTQNYRVHNHTDAGGGTHYSLQTYWKPKIRAVGQETGTVWTGQNTKALTRNVRPEGYPFTVTFLSSTTLTSKGAAPNILFRIRQHVTINANGEITTIRVEDPVVTCRG
ncbi:MAG: hypothetical protein ABEK12_03485 [Candidatus Nanohaloarchaea archaeon]